MDILFTLLNKVVQLLKTLFRFVKLEAETQTDSPADLQLEAEGVSRTYSNSNEIRSRRSVKEFQREVVRRRRISWSVIKLVNDLPIKKSLRVSQWRAVFKWRGPPRTLFPAMFFD